MGLLHVFEQRYRQRSPPQGGDDKGNLGGGLGGEAEWAHQNQQDADDKGDAAADVAQRVAVGGDAVHPLVAGDVDQHRVIEDVAGAVAQTGQHKHQHIGDPAAGEGENQQPGNAQHQKDREHPFFHAAVVGQSSQKGGEDRQNEHSGRGGQSPDARGGRLRDLLFGQRAEEDGDGGGDQHGKGGVCHVV